jgi:hypothetical protein
MKITPEIWNTLTIAIASLRACPDWLRDQANLSWEQVSHLPILDNTGFGQHAIPIVEQKTMTLDYLDFLREQINLNPRGLEWSTILKNRLTKLEPFTGKELIVATFFSKPHSFTLRVCPVTKNVICSE